MIKYYLFSFDANEEHDYSDIRKKLNLAVDWVKIFSNVFIIKSTSELGKWKTRINEIFTEEKYFVVEIEENEKVGKLNKYVWEWFKKASE
jgi:hypothetical protein